MFEHGLEPSFSGRRHSVKLLDKLSPKAARKIEWGEQDRTRDRIEVVCERLETQTRRLERNAAAAGSGIDDNCVRTAEALDPVQVTLVGEVLKSALISVGVLPKVLAGPLCTIYSAFRSNRISMDPQPVHELVAVGVGRQQRGEDRGAARHQGTPRPPDVQVVDRGKRRH